MFKIKSILSIFIIYLAIIPPISVQAEELRDIVFPIATGYDYNFSDTYGAARSGGRTHEGTDIITAKMTPLVAAVKGRVTEVVDSEEGWGLALYIEDADGYSYRYLHINNDTPGTDDNKSIRSYAFPDNIHRGNLVEAGQLVAWAGDSGNAESVGSHLHFEIWAPGRQSINSYSSLMAALAKPSVTTASTNVAPYQFTKDLELGDEDASVKELQKYLNQHGFSVAISGVGSAGKETTYFGQATQAALIKFQIAKNISPAVGYFGPKTRGIMNASNTTVAEPKPVESISQNSNGIVTAGWLVKDKVLPKVFYVAPNLELQWIVSEEVAVREFGSNWYLNIKTFDDLEALGLSFGDYIF
jgi:peptidoglycan hydrolase-like protein with peptidoglycan-binding domain